MFDPNAIFTWLSNGNNLMTSALVVLGTYLIMDYLAQYTKPIAILGASYIVLKFLGLPL